MARYAAVDIGSNSVRMMAAEVLPSAPWQILAQDREVTRLGASVFDKGRISTDAMDSVCSVLRRMSQAYSKLDVLAVRAVATSAVRDASNSTEFIQQASEALGTSVEIISGQEEARLIHAGVQSRWPQPDGRVLIIDVGGGSAEFIVGEKGEMTKAYSRPLGAVRLTEVFLQHDPPTDGELHRLRQYIDEKFAPVRQSLGGMKFDRVIATSATAAVIVSAANSIERPERDVADRQRAKVGQVKQLFRQLAASDLASRRGVTGVGPRRAEIVIAGVAVFLRAMESLELETLSYSTAGVRDGIIADLYALRAGQELSRLNRQQIQVMEEMCRKYSVNILYASHVAEFGGELFDALQPLHKLPPDLGRLLQAAGYLHDTGHYISGTGHHKHSAYIVANSDLPGFTHVERQMVSLLCRYHRKSMPQVRHDAFRGLTPEHRRTLMMMIPLLRLAVALDTTQQRRVQSVSCQVTGSGATLKLHGDGDLDLEAWAADRAADLFREVYEVPLTIVRPSQ